MLVNKREVLQPMLDKIEPGWSIKKPSPRDPCDVDHTCIFQRLQPGDYREATAAIPNEFFEMGKLADIEKLVKAAIEHARIVA